MSSHAEAAKMIRAEMKARGFKGSVRSQSYAGGNSVRVEIQQNISPAQLKEFEAFAHRFQYGHFNGMNDSYEYSNRVEGLPQVRFVFVSVEYSPEIKQEVKAYIAGISGIEEWRREQYEWMALSGSWGGFWEKREAA